MLPCPLPSPQAPLSLQCPDSNMTGRPQVKMRGETWMGMEERSSRNNSDCDLLEWITLLG